MFALSPARDHYYNSSRRSMGDEQMFYGDYRNPGLTQREGVAAVMQLATNMNQRDGLVDYLAGDTIVGEQGVTVAKA